MRHIRAPRDRGGRAMSAPWATEVSGSLSFPTLKWWWSSLPATTICADLRPTTSSTKSCCRAFASFFPIVRVRQQRPIEVPQPICRLRVAQRGEALPFRSIAHACAHSPFRHRWPRQDGRRRRAECDRSWVRRQRLRYASRFRGDAARRGRAGRNHRGTGAAAPGAAADHPLCSGRAAGRWCAEPALRVARGGRHHRRRRQLVLG